MRQTRILVLFLLLLAACGGSNQPNDTETPSASENVNETAVDTVENETESPREEAPPTATTLPPTWTPSSMEHNGHLSTGPGGVSAEPGGAAAGSIPISGTRVIYVVQRGDTLAEICHQYKASISTVASINSISDWDHIEVGQVLTIPVSGN
jgi:LysM repeat protein